MLGKGRLVSQTARSRVIAQTLPYRSCSVMRCGPNVRKLRADVLAARLLVST